MNPSFLNLFMKKYTRGRVLPMGVDVGNQRGQGHVLNFADLLEAEPESILEADARLMADNDD